MVDVMNFEGGPFDGMVLSRTDEGADDWPFQVSFDMGTEFDTKGMLIGCVRHTYRMFLSGENPSGEDWATYHYEVSMRVNVEGDKVEQ